MTSGAPPKRSAAFAVRVCVCVCVCVREREREREREQFNTKVSLGLGRQQTIGLSVFLQKFFHPSVRPLAITS